VSAPVIYWFRHDLRTHDLPGLRAALESGRPVIPCYILDLESAGRWSPGGASRWWLHYSLTALSDSIAGLGSRLVIRTGPAADVIPALVRELGADAVYCSRCHEPWAASLEQTLHQSLAKTSIDFRRYPGSVLLEPEKVANKAGLPFKVFTPFWRFCRAALPTPNPLPAPRRLPPVDPAIPGLTPEQLSLLPRNPNWAAHWGTLWQPGESGARVALKRFFSQRIDSYAEGRNFPGQESTSMLSAHLHFGEISPRALWAVATRHGAEHPHHAGQVEKFLSELGWREFSYHLLHHFPTIPEQNFKPAFSAFPWLGSGQSLRAWQQGRTGYPLVDAGMRELWATGYMHNRVRMVTGSFLVKHLLISWQRGEEWFWDTLVDADLANNACSWQWVAGSGADAAPYFRIFNPTLQGRRFDPDGAYIRRWVPELAALPDKYLHQPEKAPVTVLEAAGVSPGLTYPEPIVIHEDARQAALTAWSAVKAADG
jgi:deoxyribodipyrimidine photo-lyase